MRKLDLYWQSNRDWWEFDENLNMVLKETAPIEAKESYERYKKQKHISGDTKKQKSFQTKHP